jgi:hypothetical protein
MNKCLVYFGIILFIILSSCKKESSLSIQNQNLKTNNDLKTLVSQVKAWHDLVVSSKLTSNNETSLKSYSLSSSDIIPPSIDWDKAFMNFDSSNVKSVTVPISINYTTGECLQFVATKFKDTTNGYIIKTVPDSIYFINQQNIFDYTNFTGSIYIYNLNGQNLKKVYFKSGKVASNSINNSQISGISANSSSAPCLQCDLLTVEVYSTMKSPTFFQNDLTKSFGGIAIASWGGGGSNGYVNNGFGSVIAGADLSSIMQSADDYNEGDYSGGKEQLSDGKNTSFPQKITLTNGKTVNLYFKDTKDGISSNQQINVRTLECLKSALEIVNEDGQVINSIVITATTNGHPYFNLDGSPKISDHHPGAAIDIGAINGIVINGPSALTLFLQSALNQFPYIRENFGPGSQQCYKFGLNLGKVIPGHNGHIHFSIVIPQ